MIDTNKILFRSSATKKIMTNDRSGKALGETCKTYLKDVYRELKYGRREEVTTKQMEHGNEGEELGITLYSRFTKTFYKKNDERISNMFQSGTPDCYIGESIMKAERGIDIKCPWSLFTMPFPGEKLDENYFYQNHSYMALTGAKQWDTVYTLINHSASQIDDEKRKWSYKFGGLDPEANPLYIEKCKDIERNMIYDLGEFQKDYPHYDLATDLSDWNFDIPMAERIVVFPVMRDEEIIAQINGRILECRIWIKQNLIQ